ncbi:DUF4430 domain-containing protein [Cohnella sp. AR92]|uniref:DUF4430 domain-containing protein n=1 Tax=Cohnella sp. AR92 TaxID=648716 RepID=UPI000F8D6D92|nr:DUF4430 domain-containing protein [Cohnella sp. AR92]RUS47125.1 DUF4430 domain-containing protein [Cohnella sp. AR92]
MRMTPKKWLVAAGILCVLALAFVWGGDRPSGRSEPAAPPAATESSDLGAEASPSAGQDASSDPSSEAPDSSAEPAPQESASAPEAANSTIAPKESPGQSSALPSSGEPSPSVSAPASASPSKETASKPSAGATPSKGNKTAAGKPASPSPSASAGGKDKYLTEPVPEGKPKPVEWQDADVDKKKVLTATLSVTCKTILDNLDYFNEDKLEVLPDDGVIFASQKVSFYEGESVFDVLQREMKKHKIHMEFSMTPIYNSNYIEGINNIYEFDCGELSGWMYKVNGWFPNYGSSRYPLKDGDVIEWVYTCDLGRDVGGDKAAGAQK